MDYHRYALRILKTKTAITSSDTLMLINTAITHNKDLKSHSRGLQLMIKQVMIAKRLPSEDTHEMKY